MSQLRGHFPCCNLRRKLTQPVTGCCCCLNETATICIINERSSSLLPHQSMAQRLERNAPAPPYLYLHNLCILQTEDPLDVHERLLHCPMRTCHLWHCCCAHIKCTMPATLQLTCGRTLIQQNSTVCLYYVCCVTTIILLLLDCTSMMACPDYGL